MTSINPFLVEVVRDPVDHLEGGCEDHHNLYSNTTTAHLSRLLSSSRNSRFEKKKETIKALTILDH